MFVVLGGFCRRSAIVALAATAAYILGVDVADSLSI